MKKLLISALALFVVGSVAAQEGLGETYNKAVAAYNSKDFASAATAFETLIDQGLDSEDLDVQSWVATAKKSVPVCYFQMGLTAAKGNDFNTAVENLTKSANKAALYGELQQERMSNMLMAKIYLMWGGKPFNEKNYAEAAEIFAKGYAADPKNMEMANFLGICYCSRRLPERFGYFQRNRFSGQPQICGGCREGKGEHQGSIPITVLPSCRARMISTVLSPLPTRCWP